MSTTTASTHNGWTNYQTWLVNLELFRDYDVTENLDDIGGCAATRDDQWRAVAIKELALWFQYAAREWVGGISLANKLASEILSDVNWAEIAEHRVDDYLDAHHWPSDSDNRH